MMMGDFDGFIEGFTSRIAHLTKTMADVVEDRVMSRLEVSIGDAMLRIERLDKSLESLERFVGSMAKRGGEELVDRPHEPEPDLESEAPNLRRVGKFSVVDGLIDGGDPLWSDFFGMMSFVPLGILREGGQVIFSGLSPRFLCVRSEHDGEVPEYNIHLSTAPDGRLESIKVIVSNPDLVEDEDPDP